MNVRSSKNIHRRETAASSSPPAPLEADRRLGTRLAGYEIKAIAGRGGMGVVYRAEHVHLGRTVALKLLAPRPGESADFRDRFLTESRTAAAINHPHIITVYDAGEADGLLYIAMQYVDGTDLAGLLERAGPLEPAEAVYLLSQVGDALDAAHAHGIVHRDVKPENVLLDRDHCYLTDFGATKAIGADRGLTVKGEFVGTLDYMAPEQIEGSALDGRTDVYALGCLLYHAIVGEAPYGKESEVSVLYAHLHDPAPAASRKRPDLPSALDPLIARAMAKSREDRYATCGEFVAAIREVTEGSGNNRHSGRGTATAPRLTKVLVADGEPSTGKLVRASLDKARFSVLEATDGESAIALARDERPALVFLDPSVGAESSQGLREALRADPATASTKIVALARRSQVTLDQPPAAADDCLVKPFSPLQVLYKVRDLLGPETLVG